MSWRQNGPDVRALTISVILLLLVLVPAGAAQGIAVDPGSITFNSTAGIAGGGILNRTVIVNALDNLTEVRVFTRDLYESGGSKVIPQEAILATVPSVSMANGSLQHVPIAFDLRRVPPGLYSGDIWLNSSPGGVTKVPVTATIRRDWPAPLIILVMGVLVSFALFTYGTSMKRRDEIQVATGLIRDRARSDSILRGPYRCGPDITVDGIRKEVVCENQYCKAIRQDVAGVEEKLAIGKDTEIETAFNTLQTDWNRWSRERRRLEVLFPNYSKVVGELNDLEERVLHCGVEVDKKDPPNDTHITYFNELRSGLQSRFQDIMVDDEGKEFENEITATHAEYLRLVDVAEHIIHLEGTRVNGLEQGKDPCDDAPRRDLWDEFKTLQTETEAKDFHERVKPAETATTKGSHSPRPAEPRRTERTSKTLREAPPSTGPITRDKGKKEPSWFDRWLKDHAPGFRLKLNEYGTYAVTVLILALVGFTELYLSNPTFGATLGDWIALLIWGLLAGAAADTISKRAKTNLGFTGPGT